MQNTPAAVRIGTRSGGAAIETRRNPSLIATEWHECRPAEGGSVRMKAHWAKRRADRDEAIEIRKSSNAQKPTGRKARKGMSAEWRKSAGRAYARVLGRPKG
jgi:hypothetical protein